MLDKLKAMGSIAALMKNQDALRDAAARVRETMDAARIDGQSGAGAVRVVVSGSMKVISVDLAPALASGMAADERTRQLAGSLIAEAVNDALAKAQAKLQEAISAESRALGLGDLGGGDLGSLLG